MTIRTLETELAAANGNRRVRTLSADYIETPPSNDPVIDLGGTVANSYGYRAYQTVCLSWRDEVGCPWYLVKVTGANGKRTGFGDLVRNGKWIGGSSPNPIEVGAVTRTEDEAKIVSDYYTEAGFIS